MIQSEIRVLITSEKWVYHSTYKSLKATVFTHLIDFNLKSIEFYRKLRNRACV